MTDRKSKSKHQTKHQLSFEDRLLWQKLAETVSPLRNSLKSSSRLSETKNAKLMPQKKDQPSMAELLGERNFTQPAPIFAKKAAKTKNSASAAPFSPELNVLKRKTHKSEQVLNFDRKTRRGLSKGKYEISATLDLHGLTQAQAHANLIRFVTYHAEQNHQYVLVITGKGLSKKDGGVLRRVVPKWLVEKPLSQIVNKFEIASASHGGSGALYLQLRRQKSDLG